MSRFMRSRSEVWPMPHIVQKFIVDKYDYACWLIYDFKLEYITLNMRAAFPFDTNELCGEIKAFGKFHN